MIRHNLLVLLRTTLRSKGFFFINLIGLTAGLACTLCIYLWVRDEMQINQYHEKKDRLYQVMEHQQYADEIMTTTSTPGVLSGALKQEIPEVEYAVTTTWIQNYTLSVGEHNVKANGYHVGGDYFHVFSFEMLHGDPQTAMQDKYAMVVTKELAMKLWGTDDVVGKSLELQHETTFQITGVINEVPTASSYQFDFVMNFEVYRAENDWVEEWGNNGPPTFVVLREGSDGKAVSEKIENFIKAREEDSNVSLFLVPYTDVYLYGRYENGVQSGGRIEYVRLFSIIAVFILVIACINFMNLSTARASRRAKEVGIRKAIGAQRRSLVFQYLSESTLISICSMCLAIGLVWLVLPHFNTMTDKRIQFDMTDPVLIRSLAFIVVLTGLLAGSYPALFLSAFRPAAVLKGIVRGSWAELWARKGLVVFQFFLSVILIVAVLVIYKQVEYVQTRSLGYNKEHLIRIPVEGKLQEDRETFLTEVRRVPGVVSAASMSHTFLGRNNNTGGLNWEGKNPEEIILFENVRVNHEAIETMGLEFVEGRSFSRDHGTDTSAIIFNEAAIRVMNMKDPVGKTVRLWNQYDLTIIGVVKDFHFQSLHDVVNPLFMVLRPSDAWTLVIRLESGREKETLDKLNALYTTFNPGFTFDYKFQDDEYARLYASEQRVASLSGYFAGFAILISCLGLFGLAAYTAERRQKEIGIRKALGSTEAGIVMLLSGDFTKMVILSIVLGLPVGYLLLSLWLQRFAFHVELTIGFFLIAGAIALLVAWLTVASQAFRAAHVNPVDCLRDE